MPPALTVLILLVFMPALDAGLVGWDDDDLLLAQVRYQTLSAESVRWMFTTSYGGHFQPLTWLTYTLDWAIWKRDMFGYHLTSVLLHALTAVAFYFAARRLLAFATADSAATRSGAFVSSAAFASVLFALHPLRAESVAWLAERRDVLAGFFYVLAVACYMRYAATIDESDKQSGARSTGRWAYGAAVVSCLFSLLAKASAVTLPVVLLILDVYPLRRWKPRVHGVSPAVRGAGDRASPWIEKIPFFILALAAGVRAVVAQEKGGALYSLAQHDVWARLAQACYGLTFYVRKTLWPTNLGPLYEIPPRDVLFGPMLWISLAAVIVLGVAVVRVRRRFPAVAAAFAVYAVALLPVLGFVQSGPQLVADRYSYLSCLGFPLLAGAGVLIVLRGDRTGREAKRGWILALSAAVVITCLARATYAQADIWLAPQTLWARGVLVSPNSAIAHTNYADALFGLEKFADAAHHYERALKLNPSDPVALHHFADLHRRFGHMNDAIGLYIRALRVDPNRRRACLSLARLLLAEGRVPEAVDVLRDGVRRNPDALGLTGYLSDVLSAYPDQRVRTSASP